MSGVCVFDFATAAGDRIRGRDAPNPVLRANWGRRANILTYQDAGLLFWRISTNTVESVTPQAEIFPTAQRERDEIKKVRVIGAVPIRQYLTVYIPVVSQ